MRARRPEEEEDEERDEEEALPTETVESLREADPQSRAEALMRMQRTHGNATVQRLVRSLQVTDAGRDGRVQSIGERALEPAPSGRLDKAVLYREAIETELEKAPEPGKTERELSQDVINTVAQIFVNYQAALHMFETEVRTGQAEAVPVELGKFVLKEFAERDLFGPLAETVGDLVPELDDWTEEAADEVDTIPDEEKDSRDSAPARAMRNLVIAERRRVAKQQRLMIKDQPSMLRASEDEVSSLDEGKRGEYREEAATIREDVDRLEERNFEAEQIFKKLMDRWKAAARNSGVVSVELDENWEVTRAHLRTARGSRLAGELLKAQGNNFDLNHLKIPLLIRWQPEEFATCEAVIDANGNVTDLRGNDNGLSHLPELRQRLEREGLPKTRVMSGD
jgi:hypothetical protein